MITADDLIDLRNRLGLAQISMAERIGLSDRQLQNLESGKARLRPIHQMAIERALIQLAIEQNDPKLLGPLQGPLTTLIMNGFAASISNVGLEETERRVA